MSPTSDRDAALSAALVELQQWGVERFSIEATAARARLSAEFVRETWGSERELIVEALLRHSEELVTPPDTGSLRGDLTEMALSLADYLNQPDGRRIARMIVIDSKSHEPDLETRRQFWALRQDSLEQMFRRAAERGELREDVDAALALQLLTAPLHNVALFSARPVTPDFCRAVADLVARAVLRS
ncbi:MAG: TetR-like C-terminal domain-containing protein [Actinomycetota bacterium]|nr:TetR-like C-terminal domain-containing protein [Actinomycetota bacterium]